MRIGINAHLLAFSEDYRQAGLSRYIHEMVMRVPAILEGDRFTAFVGKAPVPEAFQTAKPRNLALSISHLPTSRAPVRILWEQTALPVAQWKKRLNLLHCPVNVIPIVSPCPAVVTVHDLVFLRYPQAFKPMKRRYLAAMTGWSCRHAAHVIAVSEATRQDVIALLGVATERVTTVHNGVGEQFRPVAQSERDRFRLEKGIAGRIVLYVGTLEPRKNIPSLLKAFATVATEPEFADVTLLVGGSKGWYYDEIFELADQLGLAGSGRVRFLGRVPDDELPLWYNVCTVFAYPSLYEGFGLPVLEAMSCGAPVIAANTSSFPEVVGDAGVLLDPHDVSAWSGAIRSLLTGTEVAARLAENGLKRASTFSWQKAARQTAEVYTRVLKDRSAKQSG